MGRANPAQARAPQHRSHFGLNGSRLVSVLSRDLPRQLCSRDSAVCNLPVSCVFRRRSAMFGPLVLLSARVILKA